MINQWLNSTWRRVVFVFLLFLAATCAVPLQASAMSQGGIIALINSQRAANGLPPLAANNKLNSSAQTKAQDMLAKGYFGHTSPSGLTAGMLIRNVGYAYITMGENLAQGYGSDGAVVSGWMASSGHRANMLNGAFRDIGVGVAGSYVVAHFGATSGASVSAPAPAPKPAAAPKQVQTQTVSLEPAVVPVQVTPATPASAPAPQEQKKKPNPYELLIEDLVEFIEYKEPKLVTSG